MAVLIGDGEIKQIIVVTAGSSNLGISPIEAARKAYAEGITVSAVGIVDLSSGDEKAVKEVEEIAKAGGGLWEYSSTEYLDTAIQNLTRKAARRTIEQIVDRQLKVIIGENIEDLEPKSRIKIVDFIQKYEENINLKCILLLDTSESMRGKLAVLKRSAIKLLENLGGRKGNSSIAVLTYPGENIDMCSIICDFTSDISILVQKLEIICSGRDTPAGPAILKACEFMHQYYEVCDSFISG